jgi:hypothetical protein
LASELFCRVVSWPTFCSIILGEDSAYWMYVHLSLSELIQLFINVVCFQLEGSRLDNLKRYL